MARQSSAAYVTYLGSDNFLPGVLALNASIITHCRFPLVVLVTNAISNSVLRVLKEKSIEHRLIEEIRNPYALPDEARSFELTYTKLNVFGLTEFQKIVYVDADMLFCDSLDELFEKPHLSAVVAGAFVNPSWMDLNSGLIVVEPDAALFANMLGKVCSLPSKDMGDQGFLHSFFPRWREDTSLHLDQRFNVPHCYLNEYCASAEFAFSYRRGRLKTTRVSNIHYWGAIKPWQISRERAERDAAEPAGQAILFWWHCLAAATLGGAPRRFANEFQGP